MLMLGMNLLFGLYGGDFFSLSVDLISSIIGFFMGLTPAYTFNEAFELIRSYVLTMNGFLVFYILFSIMLNFVPFLILAKILKIKVSEGFSVNTEVPKKFWLYLPFTIGAGFITNIVVNLLVGRFLERFTETESHIPHTVAGILLYFVLVAFVPAIFEEWAFRGILLRSLTPYGKGLALVVSSVIFGFMHIGPQRVVFATVFGLLAGFIYMKTGTIWYGVLIHLINNAFVLTVGYASNLGGDITEELISGEFLFLAMVMLAFMIFAIVGIIYFSTKKYFRLPVMRYINPPDKPKLTGKQLTQAVLLNGTTVAFICLYVISIAALYFSD